MLEFDSMIQILEAEKAELSAKVNHATLTRLAEKRRKRLQELETEISDLKKKMPQRGKAQKNVTLNSKVESMTAVKVKRLKKKDLKRQNDMVRMDSRHISQRNILKRKIEEAKANNKRLRDELDKKNTALSQRKHATTSGTVDKVISDIDDKIAIISANIYVENAIEDLTVYRDTLTSHINNLQQRVTAFDIESNIDAIADGIQSMPEARTAIKYLLKVIIEMRKEDAKKKLKT